MLYILGVRRHWYMTVSKQNIAGFREIFQNARITKITLQLAVIGAGYFIAANILGASQAREYGMDATGTGWLFGVGCIFSVLATRFYPKLRTMIGEKWLIVITGSITHGSVAKIERRLSLVSTYSPSHLISSCLPYWG